MTIVCSTVTVDLSNVTGVNRVIRWCDAPFDVRDDVGNTYTAYGALMKIDAVTTENTVSNKALNISLNGLDQSISAVVNSLFFRDKDIVIHRCFVGDGDNLITERSVYWRGFTQVPELSVDYANGTVSLSVSCRSMFALDQKPNLVRCNTQTHQVWYPNDQFYKFANSAEIAEVWKR